MLVRTEAYYNNEIDRVKTAIKNTQSEYLKKDYEKYLKRLEREKRQFRRFAG